MTQQHYDETEAALLAGESAKYDKTNKQLLVSPSLKGLKDEKEFSQGDALLNTLLTALSGAEYPVDLSDLNPVKSKILNQLLTVKMDISDVYTVDDKLLLEIIPAVRIDTLKE